MQGFHIHNKYKYSRVAENRILESGQLSGKKRKNNKTNSGIKQKRRDLPIQKKKRAKGKSKIAREDKSEEREEKSGAYYANAEDVQMCNAMPINARRGAARPTTRALISFQPVERSEFLTNDVLFSTTADGWSFTYHLP